MDDQPELPRTCTTCVLCHRRDYGYSNCTCEGTELACLAGLNLALEGKAAPWSDEVTPELAAALDVALACPKYRQGAPFWTDVDQEGLVYGEAVTVEMVKRANYTDDDEAAALFVAQRNGVSEGGANDDA